MPEDEIDPESSGHASGLKDQIISTSRTFLAYFQARAQLFAIEAREASDQIGKRVVFFAIGGALAFLGYVLLVVALIPILASTLEIAWQMMALIAAGLHLGAGITILILAAKAFSKPSFEESQNELEKDREWLARHLPTSNAKKRP